jgi:hypothetical protein
MGRVSAKDQNPERQLVKFREMGIDNRYVFVDKLSGKEFNRPRYQAMRLMIREGDLIYIDALDRLGRDYDGIIAEWRSAEDERRVEVGLTEKGKALKEQIMSDSKEIFDELYKTESRYSQALQAVQALLNDAKHMTRISD